MIDFFVWVLLMTGGAAILNLGGPVMQHFIQMFPEFLTFPDLGCNFS